MKTEKNKFSLVVGAFVRESGLVQIPNAITSEERM